MRILVIGGGTAGFVAATHVSCHLPDAELEHVYDPQIAPIGVGEGSDPRLPLWLSETAGVELEELERRCQGTLKKGTQFENWGKRGGTFINRFQPIDYVGYHFDTADLALVLSERIRSKQLADRVLTVENCGGKAEVTFARTAKREYDFVFDARGFPSPDELASSAEILDWIPTRAAVVRRFPRRIAQDVTRAIARPHGWIFHIPLAEVVSVGYMYDPGSSSLQQVEADCDAFFEQEGVDDFEVRGHIRYPSFVRRELFDGTIFRIGNTASFIEPLEATSVGITILQMRNAVRWIQDPSSMTALQAYNSDLRDYITKNSLFIGWHYACGSIFETEFWRRARERFEAAHVDVEISQRFEVFKESARDLPGLELPAIEDPVRWRREVFPLLTIYGAFGNFSQLNFAQVGHGLDYYTTASAPNRPTGR